MRHTGIGGCLRAAALLGLLLLGGCAATPQSDSLTDHIPPAYAKPRELTQVPFFPQQAYQCGPASLATIMQAQGLDVSPADLKDQVYIPERKGSLQIEMVAATRRHRLVPYILEPQLNAVLDEINAGQPVLVLQNQGVSWYPQWHYAVIIGYNLQQAELILRSGVTRRYLIRMSTFERTWQRSRYWAMLALKPGKLPVNPDELRYLQAIVGFEQTRDWPLLDQLYHTGLEQWPASRDLRMGYGNVLYAQHRREDAAEQYRRVLEAHPGFAPAHNNLAMVLAEQGHFQHALRQVHRAIELGGVHSAAYQDTLKQIQQMQASAKKPARH